MRNVCVLCAVLVLGLVGVAVAEDETSPPKRGFEDGRFVDGYFGLVYEVPDLAKGYAVGGPAVLFAGICGGEGAVEVDVELEVFEAATPRGAAEWYAATKKAWDADGEKRTTFTEGVEPYPWALFVQESLAGFQRHHGYAFFARGRHLFRVHAQVRNRSEASEASIRTALGGLSVDATPHDCFLLAHVVTKQRGGDPNDPRVLCMAGLGYNREGPTQSPALAVEALQRARAKAAEDTFTGDEMWQLVQGLGMAQLTLGEVEASVATWQEAVRLAADTSSPGDLEANASYNLACACGRLGRLDEGFAALARAFEIGGTEQVKGLREHAQGDPDLASLRADPRWAERYGAE